MVIDEFLDPLKHLLNQFTTLQEKVSFIHVYIQTGIPTYIMYLISVFVYYQCAIHGYTSENHLEKRLWLFISTS